MAKPERTVQCPRCKGSGKTPRDLYGKTMTCGLCNGTGRIVRTR